MTDATLHAEGVTMQEWTDPRYAELVQHWRETTDQQNREEAQPPTGRGFIITPPGTE